MVERSLDVIIVGFGNEATIGAAVRSVRAHPVVGRVIVVDNHSADRTAAVAEQAGADEVIVNAENVGFAPAVNQGLRAVVAERALLLNPDTDVTAGALDALSDALDGDRDAVVAGPLLVGEGGEVGLGARRFSTLGNRLLPLLPVVRRWSGRLGPEYRPAEGLADAGAPVPVDYVWGAAALVETAFLRAAGGLDERFFLYSEDEDLCRRAWADGRRVLLVPTARVGHIGGVSSSGDRGLVVARQLYAIGLLFDKWNGAAYARAYWALTRAVLVVRSLAARFLTQRDREIAAATRAHFARLRPRRTQG